MPRAIVKMVFSLKLLILLMATYSAGSEDTPEHNETFVEKSFIEMDLNKDDFLDGTEMMTYLEHGYKNLSIMESDRLFEILDMNKDAFVEKDEMTKYRFSMTVEEMDEKRKENKLKPMEKAFYDYELPKVVICDKNKDGKLSRNELFYFLNALTYLPRFEVERIWLLLDVNKDGQIPFAEFHSREYGQPDSPNENFPKEDRELFDSHDLNKDGILDYEEVTAFVTPDGRMEAAEHYEKVMKKYDENRDDKLSKEEYTKSKDEMRMFEKSHVELPKLGDDDVHGPPAEPESMIDFEMRQTIQKDEL